MRTFEKFYWLKKLKTQQIVLDKAAERLERMIWFGILERTDESLKMFNLQFNMEHEVFFFVRTKKVLG